MVWADDRATMRQTATRDDWPRDMVSQDGIGGMRLDFDQRHIVNARDEAACKQSSGDGMQ
jgi:hypothetical protein